MASHPAFDYSHLTIAERLQLVEELWDSIAADADAEALPLTDAERALIDERLADLSANPATGRPWADVRAGIVGTGGDGARRSSARRGGPRRSLRVVREPPGRLGR